MKLKYPGPFEVDIPAIGVVGLEPGAEIDVPDEAIAESLLRQGYEPVDEEAELLLVKINTPEPEPEPDPNPEDLNPALTSGAKPKGGK